MQSLATALPRYLCSRGPLAWSHVDNFLCAHPDPTFLHRTIQSFLLSLNRSGILIHPEDTVLLPSQTMPFFGSYLDTL